jgi:hypothetical protein
MFRTPNRDGMRPASLLAHHDLKATLVPLNRYGMGGLSAALADGLVALMGALMGASRATICAGACRAGE